MEVNLINESFINRVITPMVRLGVYKDQNEAFNTLAVDFVKRKVKYYQRKIKRFEQKHQMNFKNFTNILHLQPSINKEDEWMEWETAIIFLQKWQEINHEIKRHNA